MVTGADFLMIPSNDFEASMTFYGETLGLERGKPWGDRKAREFETGNLTIAVLDPTDFGMTFAPNPNALALQVDDVAKMRADLEAAGVEFAMDTIDSGVCHMAVFHDPCGNQLMLHQRYAPKEADAG